jgi:hypothetical protein
MKLLFNSLNFIEKSLPVFLFFSLFYLFRKIDRDILLDPNLSNGGRTLSWMWRFLFQSGIMPLVYSLSLFFIILSNKGKKINEKFVNIESCSLIGKVLFFVAIITIGFCFKNDHGIYLIIAKGLTFSIFWLLLLFLVFIVILM